MSELEEEVRAWVPRLRLPSAEGPIRMLRYAEGSPSFAPASLLLPLRPQAVVAAPVEGHSATAAAVSIRPPEAPLSSVPMPADAARWLLAELTLVAFSTLAASQLAGLDREVSGLLVLVCLVIGYRSRRLLSQPGRPSLAVFARESALAYACVGIVVGAGWLPSSQLLSCAEVLAVGGLTMAAVTRLRSRSRGPVRVLVVGDRRAVTRATMTWGATTSIKVVGALLTDTGDIALAGSETPQTLCGVPTVVGYDDVARWAAAWTADLVVVGMGSDTVRTDIRRLAWLLEDSTAGLAAVDALDSVAPHRITVSSGAGTTFLNIAPSRPSVAVRATKALLDRVLGFVLLVACAPVIALFLLAIRLDSTGPGVFRQVRVGKDNKPFLIYKLRTMCLHAERDRDALLDANEGAGPLFKIRDDPRVTRVGRFLRRSSLDELPQLVNVVRGQMSLVGPRPALPVEVAEYDDVESRRLAVRPGMTGLWQVSGRSNLNWESSMALDLAYTDNWRLSGDAHICLRTFGALLQGDGAY